jgi:hypothetical protein
MPRRCNNGNDIHRTHHSARGQMMLADGPGWFSGAATLSRATDFVHVLCIVCDAVVLKVRPSGDEFKKRTRDQDGS